MNGIHNFNVATVCKLLDGMANAFERLAKIFTSVGGH